MKRSQLYFFNLHKIRGGLKDEKISPTILEAAKTLSKVASQGVSKEKSTDKGKRYRRKARSMAKKIDTGLDAEEEINTGREEINTGIEEVSNGSTKVDSGKMTLRAQETCMIWLEHIGGLEGDEEGLVDVLVKLETSFDEGAPCTLRKNSKVLFRRPCILSQVDNISPKGFLSPILLWVVIIVAVVIVIVRVVVVVEIIRIITVVAIIRIVVAIDGVSSIFKLSFTIIGFLYRIMLEYLIH
ncbi:hypothetical protein Tco_0328947 [Tanacetum coccineum]